LKISSNIPRGGGLGSSAALSTATAAAWLHAQNKVTTKDQISTLALQFEKQFHSKPSGIDTTTSTFGGLLWFRRETPDLILKQSLDLPNEPVFAIVQTGKPKESTAQMVEMVKERLAAKKENTRSIFQNMEDCTRGIANELLTGKVDSLSLLLNENGLLLEKLDVVSPKTKALCEQLRMKGFACKITGAGGKKDNSGALLVYCPDAERYNLLNAFNLTWDKASFSPRGVELEESV
jgi:mevalonate kinase